MAGDVDLDYDIVTGSVRQLLKLHDVAEQMASTVGQLRSQQTTAVWTNVQGLSEFARSYRGSIGAAEADLRVLREELAQASGALAASLRSHEIRDADEQQRMQALLSKLDAAASVPSTAAAPSPAKSAGGPVRSIG